MSWKRRNQRRKKHDKDINTLHTISLSVYYPKSAITSLNIWRLTNDPFTQPTADFKNSLNWNWIVLLKVFVYLRIWWAYFNGLCFAVEVRRRLFLHQQLGAVDGGSQGTFLVFSSVSNNAACKKVSAVSRLPADPDEAWQSLSPLISSSRWISCSRR